MVFALGLFDAKGVMCLIDPQCHTCVNLIGHFVAEQSLNVVLSKSKNENSTYWDRGERYITAFKKEHSGACGDNWVCNGLSLGTIKAQNIEDDNGGSSDSGSSTAVKVQPKHKGPLLTGELLMPVA
jgi:hypothetical protein